MSHLGLAWAVRIRATAVTSVGTLFEGSSSQSMVLQVETHTHKDSCLLRLLHADRSIYVERVKPFASLLSQISVMNISIRLEVRVIAVAPVQFKVSGLAGIHKRKVMIVTCNMHTCIGSPRNKGHCCWLCGRALAMLKT